MRKTVIVGGGITGLATAFALKERGYTDFVLIECSKRWGGKITSSEQGGFLVEGGPDSFLAQKKATLELCSSLGLDSELVGSNGGKNATTYVLSKRHLHAMPEGMMLMAPTMMLPFLKSRLVSWAGKLRMGLEVLVPKRKTDEDESLGSFVRRRLGNEALNKIAGPLMGGIHAADPDKLSLKSTFPMFLEIEKKHGSLLRGMMKKPKQAPAQGQKRGPMFVTLRGGLKRLSEALVAELPTDSLISGICVLAVHPEDEKYRVVLSNGGHLLADEIVFATPAHVTASLVQQIDPLLASRLRGIRYVSTATVSLGYRRSDIQHPMEGSGFIVPQEEGRRITACSWSSEKFQHRAPGDCVLLRVFIGGAMAEELAEQEHEQLIAIAQEEVRAVMGIDATPVLAQAYRWHKGNPQYEVGHEERVQEIERALEALPGLFVAGAAYRGAGIPDCIQSGTHAAEAVLAHRAKHHLAPEQELIPAGHQE